MAGSGGVLPQTDEVWGSRANGIHFGLGMHHIVERLVVRWTEKREEIRRIDSNRFYRIVQGSSVAKDWVPF